jgi:hypothetical protein
MSDFLQRVVSVQGAVAELDRKRGEQGVPSLHRGTRQGPLLLHTSCVAPLAQLVPAYVANPSLDEVTHIWDIRDLVAVPDVPAGFRR